MKSLTLKIKNGVPEAIGISGDYVRVKTASVPVRIQVETGDVDATIEQGDALNLKRFTRLVVSHADAAEQTVTLLIGDGTSADSAKVGGSVSVSALPVYGGALPSTYLGQAGVAVSTEIVPANASRKFLFIQNTSGAQDFWITFDGGASAVGSGMKIGPGDSYTFDRFIPTGPVTVYSTALALTALQILEG